MTSISWSALLWCFVPVVLVSGVYLSWCKSELSELLTACLRMVVQLIGVGFILVWLFARPSPWITLAVMLVMLTIAAWISVRPLRHISSGSYQFWTGAAIALGISVGSHLFITVAGVLGATPWYTPGFIIPLAGMYFANTMNAISLSAERYYSERNTEKDALTARKTAFRACMIPQVNGLLAVGLVALPGMMTGQILAGVEPMVAVRYQIMIMAMLLGTTGTGAAIMLLWLEKKGIH